jgi:glycosyltransferase involved in cell wall biosynthesis
VRPPIVNAMPEQLTGALESLLDDRPRAEQISKESVAYARENHDGRRTAAAFADFLAP